MIENIIWQTLIKIEIENSVQRAIIKAMLTGKYIKPAVFEA